jgi:hypothetical protein
MKFWLVTACRSIGVPRRFGVIYRLHLYGLSLSEARNQNVSLPPASADFYIGLLVGPEDRGAVFLRTTEPYSTENLSLLLPS